MAQLTGKKIGILGFSFKANTNDTRESSAIKICEELLDERSHLIIYDPKVTKAQIEEDLFSEDENHDEKNSTFKNNLTVSNNIYDVFNSTDCVVIITEWENFSNINWDFASEKMRKLGMEYLIQGVLLMKKLSEQD